MPPRAWSYLQQGTRADGPFSVQGTHEDGQFGYLFLDSYTINCITSANAERQQCEGVAVRRLTV
jgi:hypothetical protein